MNFQAQLTRHEQWQGFAIKDALIDAFSSLSATIKVPVFDTHRMEHTQGAGTIGTSFLGGGICSEARQQFAFIDTLGGGGAYQLEIRYQDERVIGGGTYLFETIASPTHAAGTIMGVRGVHMPYVTIDITETGGIGVMISGWWRVFSGFGAGGGFGTVGPS